MTIFPYFVPTACLFITVYLIVVLSLSLSPPKLQTLKLTSNQYCSTISRRFPRFNSSSGFLSEKFNDITDPLSLGTLLLLFDVDSQLFTKAEQSLWLTNRTDYQQLLVQDAIATYKQSVTESDVGSELAKFRKIILSLDKYRINDPGNMAMKYNKLLRLSLTVPNCWAGAANAVEYAGLYFPKYIQFDTITQTSTVNATNVWKDTLTQLLDMEYQSSSMSTPKGETWDQKFFAQNEVSETSSLAVHDMLLYIFRLALHIAFTKDSAKNIHIIFSEMDQEQVRFFPSLRSVQLAIRRDHALDTEIVSSALLTIKR